MTRRFVALATSTMLLILGAPSVSSAGDACPIDFIFHDLGAPDWLDRDGLLGALTSQDSWVGISFASGKNGMPVRHVSDKSPAQAAGLTKGDLITSIDGKEFRDDKKAVTVFSAAKPGTTLSLGVTRGTETLTLKLKLGFQDPVIGALIDLASEGDCSHVRRKNLHPDRRATLLSKVFSKDRRFQCKTAHRNLKKELEPGDIVFVRGSKRILIANPGFGTTCISAADYDGAKLTKSAIKKLFDKVTRAYISDRHSNP